MFVCLENLLLIIRNQFVLTFLQLFQIGSGAVLPKTGSVRANCILTTMRRKGEKYRQPGCGPNLTGIQFLLFYSCYGQKIMKFYIKSKGNLICLKA